MAQATKNRLIAVGFDDPDKAEEARAALQHGRRGTPRDRDDPSTLGGVGERLLREDGDSSLRSK